MDSAVSALQNRMQQNAGQQAVANGNGAAPRVAQEFGRGTMTPANVASYVQSAVKGLEYVRWGHFYDTIRYGAAVAADDVRFYSNPEGQGDSAFNPGSPKNAADTNLLKGNELNQYETALVYGFGFNFLPSYVDSLFRGAGAESPISTNYGNLLTDMEYIRSEIYPDVEITFGDRENFFRTSFDMVPSFMTSVFLDGANGPKNYLSFPAIAALTLKDRNYFSVILHNGAAGTLPSGVHMFIRCVLIGVVFKPVILNAENAAEEVASATRQVKGALSGIGV